MVTEKEIEVRVNLINQNLSDSTYAYDASHRSHKLVKVVDQGSDTHYEILFSTTKRELFEKLNAFLAGVREGKKDYELKVHR